MKRILVLLLVVLFVGGLVLIRTNKKPDVVNETKQTEVLGAEDNVESESLTISKQFGSVEITLEPNKLVANETMVFTMAINTHSGSLDYDWTKIVNTKDNMGNEYKVTGWTGETGGHHLKGELVFEELKAEAGEVVLTINDVDGATENYVWKVK